MTSEPVNPNGDLDLLELIQGQVHALKAFALALAVAHPQPDALAKEAAITQTVAQPVSDNFLDGMNEVLEHPTRQLERAGKSRGSPGTH